MHQSGCTKLYQTYRIQGEIGRGASGVCYSVVHLRSKEVFAMKKIHVTSMRRNSTREACCEVQLLAKLSHPHIIKMHEFFSDEEHLYIVMQYASKGDLHQILKRRRIRRDIYSEQELWSMAYQILSALEYLHARSVIHRDVKTLNIFVDAQSRLYLGDLGVSKILKADCGLYSRVGTPLYLAPEIIRSEKYDHKADIWGLGCVCYQMAALEHPFEGKNIIHLGQNIVSAHPKPLLNYSASLNAFVMDMLEKNPLRRPSASELLKKYFHNRPLQLPSAQQKQAGQNSDVLVQKIEAVNKISGGRQLLEMRGDRMKRQAMNNFLEDKLEMKNDAIEEQLIGRKQTDDFEQTIILGKKGENQEDVKKYVEATRKTCIVGRSEHLALSNHQQEKPVACKLLEQRQQKNSFLSFSSQKKFVPPPPECSKPKNVSLASYSSFEQQKLRRGGTQASRLPSETSIVSGKGRVRPKSSIMTKERHESTMKNIRRNFRRVEIEDLDSFVETRFLKRPQVIML